MIDKDTVIQPIGVMVSVAITLIMTRMRISYQRCSTTLPGTEPAMRNYSMSAKELFVIGSVNTVFWKSIRNNIPQIRREFVTIRRNFAKFVTKTPNSQKILKIRNSGICVEFQTWFMLIAFHSHSRITQQLIQFYPRCRLFGTVYDTILFVLFERSVSNLLWKQKFVF